jgi:hypothetical protein
MVYIALFRVLVISGRRILLKLCFQVFIVLSPADESGGLPCARGCVRVVAVLMIYRVVFSDPCIRSISSFVIVRWCYARTSLSPG